MDNDDNKLAEVRAILADFALKMAESHAIADVEMQKIRDMQAETALQMKQSSEAFDRRSEAFELQLQQSRADFDQRNADFDRRSEAFELQMKQSRADFDQRNADFDRRSEAFDLQLKQSRADYDRRSEAFDRQLQQSSADYDRRMINFEKTMGSWSRNHGSFAEEYFFNSFENGRKNFFGEMFDEINKNVPGIKIGFRDEYDIILTNGKFVCIIEVKFKAHHDHIAKILKKAETFRENFPYYANHQVYLGFASLSFDKNIEQECIANGIAIIKQIGDSVVINDEHLKVF